MNIICTLMYQRVVNLFPQFTEIPGRCTNKQGNRDARLSIIIIRNGTLNTTYSQFACVLRFVNKSARKGVALL